MLYDETTNGSEVELCVGDEFELSLAETRTAGYRWVLKSQGEPACTLLNESSQPATGKVGGSGMHSWRFRGVTSGTGSLALEYARSWETTSGPERTFAMKVRVRPCV